MEQETGDGHDVTPLRLRPGARILRELRRHPYAWGLTLVFGAAGAIGAPLLIPHATPWMGAAGGLAFGVYAALCAVPDKFLG